MNAATAASSEASFRPAQPAISPRLTAHWTAVARSLGPGSRVLDLGCGTGIVGRLMLAARPDLRVTGIDSATVPPSTLANLQLESGVAMESLPFAPRRFAAVVSQFGFEYGDRDATTREIERVSQAGARLSFVVHHAGSASVAAGRARVDAAQLEHWLVPLRRLCLLGPAVALLQPDGTPIAWRIEGTRRN